MAAVSLAEARGAVEQEAARALPPDDPLRPLVDALVAATAALEEAEARISTDAMDRLARAAVYSVTAHLSTLIRAVLWRYAPWALASLSLAWIVGAVTGWVWAGVR